MVEKGTYALSACRTFRIPNTAVNKIHSQYSYIVLKSRKLTTLCSFHLNHLSLPFWSAELIGSTSNDL